MRLKSISKTVKVLLEKYPHLRDSDNKLIASVWYIELERAKYMSGMEILTSLADGKLSSSESIRRSRQKLQEEIPSLRGKTYRHRKTTQEQETRNEIRNFQA